MVCVLCVSTVLFLRLCFRTKHFRFVQTASCVTSRIGKRSFNLMSLLLPANATQSPGMHPFTHASLRALRICPSQFRTPLVRSLNCFAIPLHTSKGCFCPLGNTRLVHGASCLHSVGLLFARHAFGIMRFSFPVLLSVTNG